MENLNLGPAEAGAVPAAPRRFGRAKRIAATVAVSAALLGAGAAIGSALTGGASASTGTSASTSTSVSAGSSLADASSAFAAGKCAKIAAKLRVSGRPAAAMRLRALCRDPLLRLSLTGGEYGQVTFKGKTSPKTIAFERGTAQSVTGSAVTVRALDGTTWTWDLTASTHIHAAGQKAKQAKLAAGDRVFVGGPVVGGARDARLIRIGAAG
jgi:hypothetical protein